LLLEVFTQRNFVADFVRQKLNFTGRKQQNRVLCHLLGDLGVGGNVGVHGSSISWLVGRLSMLIETFSPALTVEALWADIGRNCCARRGWVTKRKFQGVWRSPTNDCWRQKTRIPGLSHGVVCV